MKSTDIRIRSAQWHPIPVQTRIPIKFGPETVSRVVCARACVEVENGAGSRALGWGETPLSVTWVWPSTLPYAERLDALTMLCDALAKAYARFEPAGHAMEIGHSFLEHVLDAVHAQVNAQLPAHAQIPHLAALVCASAFDIALHDAYGTANGVPTYATYQRPWMDRDLSTYLEPAPDAPGVDFRGKFPADFFRPPPRRLLAWHLVGGLDALEPGDPGSDPLEDGYPVTLTEWIRRDGLLALKVKLRGNDAAWDLERMVRVGGLALSHGVEHLTADFNCTVTDPQYVHAILDQLETDHPRIWSLLRYVEQPFPYDLDANRILVHSIAGRVPLFLDESAHDWRVVRLGRDLGWNGVALKTCKTQTGALLSLCWAQTHGMQLMVQDLTNPMLAQIPHVLLAAHAPTLAGVETNAMQFYPEASAAEARIHPGLYTRREGHVDWSTLGPTGFGYRLEDIRSAAQDAR